MAFTCAWMRLRTRSAEAALCRSVPVRVPQGQQLDHAPPLLAVRRAGIIRQGPKRLPIEVLGE
eukprot:5690158-Heterocapsa_arctica.AAC.1